MNSVPVPDFKISKCAGDSQTMSYKLRNLVIQLDMMRSTIVCMVAQIAVIYSFDQSRLIQKLRMYVYTLGTVLGKWKMVDHMYILKVKLCLHWYHI